MPCNASADVCSNTGSVYVVVTSDTFTWTLHVSNTSTNIQSCIMWFMLEAKNSALICET